MMIFKMHDRDNIISFMNKLFRDNETCEVLSKYKREIVSDCDENITLKVFNLYVGASNSLTHGYIHYIQNRNIFAKRIKRIQKFIDNLRNDKDKYLINKYTYNFIYGVYLRSGSIFSYKGNLYSIIYLYDKLALRMLDDSDIEYSETIKGYLSKMPIYEATDKEFNSINFYISFLPDIDFLALYSDMLNGAQGKIINALLDNLEKESRRYARGL